MEQQKNMKALHWIMVVNNYTDKDMDAFKDNNCLFAYWIYGKEVGESGTPHLQCYMKCTKQTTMMTLKKIWSRAHFEIKSRHSSVLQCVNYCRKDGKYTESGDPPVEPHVNGNIKNQELWDQTLRLAKEGNMNDINSKHTIIYYNTLNKIADDFLPIPKHLDWVDGKTPNKWYWGPTGTGKSRKARTENPDAYIKDVMNHWWTGYKGESVAIIEDISTFHVAMGDALKIWADRYAFPANKKFGGATIRPQVIIVTSNFKISDIWADENTHEPLYRRFEEIYIGPRDMFGAPDPKQKKKKRLDLRKAIVIDSDSEDKESRCLICNYAPCDCVPSEEEYRPKKTKVVEGWPLDDLFDV